MTSLLLAVSVLCAVNLVTFAAACSPLLPPKLTWPGHPQYTLLNASQCQGKVTVRYEHQTGLDPCMSTCRDSSCAAVNLIRESPTSFKCQILSVFFGVGPNANASCYKRG